MHTPLCKHSKGDPEEFAAVAWERGMAGITVTCHNPLPNNHSISVRMREDQWGEYTALVERARGAWAGRIDVRRGLECDYFPGIEGYLEKQIGEGNLSHVLGSVHSQTREWVMVYGKGDALSIQKNYFEHLAMAAETGLFDTISHPDLVKNQTASEWDLKRIWPDILRTLDRIAKAGVAMELNTSGVLKVIPEMNPGPEMLRAMSERGIPAVIGAYAHEPGRCGDRFLDALALLEAAGYKQVSFFVGRKRRDIAIGEARASLKF
jgi:histidinol-phosphatase (PHP family)